MNNLNLFLFDAKKCGNQMFIDVYDYTFLQLLKINICTYACPNSFSLSLPPSLEYLGGRMSL